MKASELIKAANIFLQWLKTRDFTREPLKPMMESWQNFEHISTIQQGVGFYILRFKISEEVAYIGASKNLLQRIRTLKRAIKGNRKAYHSEGKNLHKQGWGDSSEFEIEFFLMYTLAKLFERFLLAYHEKVEGKLPVGNKE